jgi:hypothetical protein
MKPPPIHFLVLKGNFPIMILCLKQTIVCHPERSEGSKGLSPESKNLKLETT